MAHCLTEEALIEYVKPYFKSKGFKKKGKRWVKETDEFTISFLIQGSSYSKEGYYIRPGIFINALLPTDNYYGHWMTEIEQTTAAEVVKRFEIWSLCGVGTRKLIGDLYYPHISGGIGLLNDSTLYLEKNQRIFLVKIDLVFA